MATPIENAKKRLADLEREKAEIEQFLRMYDRFSGGTESAWSDTPNATQSKETYPQKFPVNNGENNQRRLGPTPNEIVAIMERMIREVGRPMTRGEIVEGLDRRDVVIPAQDKPRYVGTLAWRHKSKFVNVDGRGYWVRGEPWAMAPGVHMTTDEDPPEERSDEVDDAPDFFERA